MLELGPQPVINVVWFSIYVLDYALILMIKSQKKKMEAFLTARGNLLR